VGNGGGKLWAAPCPGGAGGVAGCALFSVGVDCVVTVHRAHLIKHVTSLHGCLSWNPLEEEERV
jgi:hypothetical protein